MIKYVDTMVTFREIPDEISLCISISGCPGHCKNCHSPYLAQDIGEILNKESLLSLIKQNTGITCVVFMGGDQAPNSISWLAKCVKEEFPELKIGWYSGKETLSDDIDLKYFDYIKLGPYKEELGGLDNPTTNQRLYAYNELFSDITIEKSWRDITSKFWKHD